MGPLSDSELIDKLVTLLSKGDIFTVANIAEALGLTQEKARGILTTLHGQHPEFSPLYCFLVSSETGHTYTISPVLPKPPIKYSLFGLVSSNVLRDNLSDRYSPKLEVLLPVKLEQTSAEACEEAVITQSQPTSSQGTDLSQSKKGPQQKSILTFFGKKQ